MARTILHVDLNAFYASVECLYRPDLCGQPVRNDSGDVEARHGIILAKNDLAKKAGVKTGDAIWQAKRRNWNGRWTGCGSDSARIACSAV